MFFSGRKCGQMGVVGRRSVELSRGLCRRPGEGLGRSGGLSARPPRRMRTTRVGQQGVKCLNQCYCAKMSTTMRPTLQTVPESLPADHVTAPTPAPATTTAAAAPSQPRHPRPMFKVSPTTCFDSPVIVLNYQCGRSYNASKQVPYITSVIRTENHSV